MMTSFLGEEEEEEELEMSMSIREREKKRTAYIPSHDIIIFWSSHI